MSTQAPISNLNPDLTATVNHQGMLLTLREAAIAAATKIALAANPNTGIAEFADGVAELQKLLPAPFKLYISDHDTGCHAAINLEDAGVVPVRAWSGSQWTAPIFAQGDKRELGINPDVADFAQPILQKFFEDVTQLVHSQQAAQAAQTATDITTQADAIGHYREQVEQASTAPAATSSTTTP